MHIALLISSLESGGAERSLSELANYWARKGQKISLITLAKPDSKPFYTLDPKINLIQINQTQQKTSIFVRPRNILRRISCLRKILKALSPNLIISFVDVMNLITLLATIKLNIPVIVSERTHPAHYYIPFLYRKARALLYPKASYVVAQTASAASYFKNLTNIKIIPNAVAPFLKSRKAKFNSVQHIVSVGRLCPFKGFNTLIQAFFRLHKEYPELQLTIYGEGKERSELTKLIKSLSLQKKVSLPGITQNISKILMAADLFIFPSYYEGFPNALCEAMASGLPVIASNCSGNIDIIRDGFDGRFFPVGDANALNRIMSELLNDEDQRNRLARNAKAICERFHPDHVYRLWDELIEEVFNLEFF